MKAGFTIDNLSPFWIVYISKSYAEGRALTWVLIEQSEGKCVTSAWKYFNELYTTAALQRIDAPMLSSVTLARAIALRASRLMAELYIIGNGLQMKKVSR